MASLVNNLGGTLGFGEFYIPRNDDGYVEGIDLTGIFGLSGLNFFGTTFTYAAINNNGSVTLTNGGTGGGLGTYTPFDLANGGYAIVAPFFADVDTSMSGGSPDANQVAPSPGGTSRGSDLVWYDMSSTGYGKLTVTWDDVGFFSSNTSRLNAFQLQIIGKGSGNFDMIFRYEHIDWTTGSASGGMGGLGGIVARAGYSTGDGNSWYELPQSGSQSGMLGLDDTPGNTGVAGYYKYSVRSGSTANDVMQGTADNDLMAGGLGNDRLMGYAGADFLVGNQGADRLVGGFGDDTYTVDMLDTIVERAGEGSDTVMTAFDYTLGANLENLRLTGDLDSDATGNALGNTFAGSLGNNVIDGKGGSDTIDFSDINTGAGTAGITVDLSKTDGQLIAGNQGVDTLLNIENVIGTIKNDVIAGTAGANVLDGNLGADAMNGGNGSDTYFVDEVGDSVEEATAGAAGGTDTVVSALDAYTLGGNVENGFILSDFEASMTGNSLRNVIHAGNGDNVIDGGAGVDTLSYAYSRAGVNVSLATAVGQDTGGSGIDLIMGFEDLAGSKFGDALRGSSAANVISGGGGADTLTGGLGGDTFAFATAADAGAGAKRDVITDFTAGADKLDLSAMDADRGLAGNQAFTFIGAATFDGVDATGQLRFVFSATTGKGIVYGSTDADADAEFSIELTGVSSLDAADLLL